MAEKFRLIPVNKIVPDDLSYEFHSIEKLMDIVHRIRLHNHINNVYRCPNLVPNLVGSFKLKLCKEELSNVIDIVINTTEYYVTYKCDKCGYESTYGMMINYGELLDIEGFKEVSLK